MTRSELMAVMTGGFVTIAGGVLVAYVGILSPRFPDIAGHLIAASVMGAPAGLVMAKLMLPETEESLTAGTVKLEAERPWSNVIDAAAEGATAGLELALNVAAMLLAFLGLLALLNAGLGWLGGFVGFRRLTLEGILGWLLQPLAWVMGTPWAEADKVGTLIGIKTGANEFIAYTKMGDMIEAGRALRALARDRDLRAVRLLQLLVDRDPDRRHRRDGAGAQVGARRARPARDGRRLARLLPDRRHRGVLIPRLAARVGSGSVANLRWRSCRAYSGCWPCSRSPGALSTDRRRVNWRAVSSAPRCSSSSRC